MKSVKTIVIIIAAVVAVAILAVVGVNSFAASAIRYEEKVTEALSDVKVQEKERADLLPNLANCVKEYDKHEYDTLVAVINARKQSDGTISDSDAEEIKEMIVKFVNENYPELQSQKNYSQLMKDITTQENLIREARKAYNSAVSRYNEYVRNPNHKFFLNLTGYEFQEFSKLDYEVSADAPTNLFG